MERVMSYVLRFIKNCKVPECSRERGPLLAIELYQSHKRLASLSQQESFPEEFSTLKSKNALPKKNRLSSLNPYFDEHDHIIRVGGRLSQSDLSYEKKHPTLISSKHPFAKVLFLQEHLRLLHAGPQLLLSNVRDSYWPLGGRSLAKSIVRNCVRCFRVKPPSIHAIMGDLPSDRVTPQSPFSVVGTDFAGPFLIKDRKGRGAKITKCYLCVFICFTTKACHLELVSNLSTEAFILALRRFVARRGMPTKIFSDNGKNFVGANNKLKELYRFLSESNLKEVLASEKFNWIFLPPYSPHMGGLWESCVKSIKFHLKRVMHNLSFTFEQLNSLIIQVEGILNSRPLCPLSSDPNDYESLTPSHFLMGKTATTVPDPSLAHIPQSRLDTYQHLQVILQHLWSRWSKEYLAELMRRNKWQQRSENLKVDTLVILKDDNLPPSRWHLGRVVDVHPGPDGTVRVVTVRTSSGLTRRAITKVCALPTSA